MALGDDVPEYAYDAYFCLRPRSVDDPRHCGWFFYRQRIVYDAESAGEWDLDATDAQEWEQLTRREYFASLRQDGHDMSPEALRDSEAFFTGGCPDSCDYCAENMGVACECATDEECDCHNEEECDYCQGHNEPWDEDVLWSDEDEDGDSMDENAMVA